MPKQKPTISVIMPSYNHGNYIEEAIQSVLSQTFKNFELIIIDDGSSDNSIKKIKKINDPRISLYIKKQNSGAAFVTNEAIKKAKGQYIAILNSDDVFHCEKLKKQLEFLEKHKNIGAVFSHASIIDQQGRNFVNKNHFYNKIFNQKNRNRFKWLNSFFFNGNCLCHPSILIRKECYDTVGLYDERLSQLPDFDMWIRLCLKYNIHILPEKLIKFRILDNEANASGQTPENINRTNSENYIILKRFLNIKKTNDLKRIFPKNKDIIKNNDNRLIPFLILQIILCGKKQYKLYRYNTFAIIELFNVLNNQEITKEIKQKYNFTYKTFAKIAGKIDMGISLNQKDPIIKKLLRPIKQFIMPLLKL